MAEAPARRRASLKNTLLSLLAVCVALVFVFPLYWAFSTSLRNPIDTFTVAGLGIPWLNFEPTLANWRDQLGTPETLKALTNSTVIAVSASLLALLLGTPAAYAIARFEFRRWRNRDITVWFLSQRVLPPVATVIPFYLVMRTLGLLDTHLALILVNATFVLPFVVVIMRQTFLDLPAELEEAARTDGATPAQIFRYILLPQLLPTIAVLAVLRFIWTFNNFDDIYLLTGGGAGTEVVAVSVFNALTARGDIGGAAAQALVLAAILAAFIGLYLWRLAPREEHS